MANNLNKNEAFAITLFTTAEGRKALEAIPADIRNALCAGAKRDLLAEGDDGNWDIAKKGINFGRRIGRVLAVVVSGITALAVKKAIFDEVDGSRARFDGSAIIKRLDMDPKSQASEPVRKMLRDWGKDGTLTVEGAGFHTKYRVTNTATFFAVPVVAEIAWTEEATTEGAAADEVSAAAEVTPESGDEAATTDEVTGNVESGEVVADESSEAPAAEVAETPAEVVAEETPVAYTGRKGRGGRKS